MSDHQPEDAENLLKDPVDQFTLDFLRKKWESNDEDNIFLSPIGIMIAYIMLLEGACGTTTDQIISIFRLKPTLKDIGVIRNESSKVIGQLNQVDENLTLKMKNKIIINHEKEVKSSYEEVLSQYYSSSVDRENFKDSIVMDKLNSWVAGETYNLIPRLFDESFDPETVLVLVNILYFKGSWIEPFLVSNTIQDIFHNLDGTKSTVDMMNSPDSTFHFSDMLDENLKIIRLPYKREISMFIFMPTLLVGLQELILNLTAESMGIYLRSLHPTEFTEVGIPRFQLEDIHDLRAILTSMGLDLPFSNSAELHGISDGPVKVSESIQRTMIFVDERGTEAAAATSITPVMFSASSGEAFILDRPFLFLIRDEKSSINLFAGIVKKFPDIASPSHNY